MSGIFNAAIFNNTIFNTGTGVTPPIVDVVKTGTGGADPGEGGVGIKKRKTIVKPTGLVFKKEGRKEVEDRIDESRQIQAEIAGRLAREFTEETQALAVEAKNITEMLPAEIDREIGVLLRQKLKTEEEELMLLLMIAASE